MLDRKHLDAWLDGLPDPSTAHTVDHALLDVGQSDFVGSLPTDLTRPRPWIAFAPVNKLPNEILVEILTLANPDPPSDMALPPVRTKEPSVIGPASWLLLMLVCRHWHAVIHSNACFWRAVNVHRDLHHFWFALLQTRKANFDMAVHHHKVVRYAVPVLTTMTRRLQRLLLSRLKCAYLRLALVLLEGRLPALQELTVLRDFFSPEACRSTPWIELPKERFPVLSTLRLSGVTYPQNRTPSSSARTSSRFRSLNWSGPRTRCTSSDTPCGSGRDTVQCWRSSLLNCTSPAWTWTKLSRPSRRRSTRSYASLSLAVL